MQDCRGEGPGRHLSKVMARRRNRHLSQQSLVHKCPTPRRLPDFCARWTRCIFSPKRHRPDVFARDSEWMVEQTPARRESRVLRHVRPCRLERRRRESSACDQPLAGPVLGVRSGIGEHRRAVSANFDGNRGGALSAKANATVALSGLGVRRLAANRAPLGLPFDWQHSCGSWATGHHAPDIRHEIQVL